MLQGRKILLAVAGSIAAYKSAFIVRLLVKQGAEVRVILTPSAKDFVTPLTLATLSKNPVESEYFDDTTGAWTNHVELGNWADLFVLAPATANTLAKMASGVCDNLVLATYLSATCDIMIAPAMDRDMLQHDSTQTNIAELRSRRHLFINTEVGELASGLHADGRMAEPEQILEAIIGYFNGNLPLSGKKVLISAGPTYEAIDPVRFIGNRSSGKMGYAIAREAMMLGAEVHLISGPTAEQAEAGIQCTLVESADEMYAAVTESSASADIIIMAAAVADYKPVEIGDQKIKKEDEQLSIHLSKTKDILSEIGANKTDKQLLVGFALETENELSNAKGKLERKNLDMIILNSLNDSGAGFGVDTNKVTIITKDNKVTEYELKSKDEVARDILAEIISSY